MATIYAAPEKLPEFGDAAWNDENGRLDWKKYEAAEEAYIKRMQQAARDANPGDQYAGEMYYVPRGDGKAVYVVWRSKPFALIHLEVGDNWAASAAEERGLRLSDIKAQIEFEKMWRETGERQAKEREAAKA